MSTKKQKKIWCTLLVWYASPVASLWDDFFLLSFLNQQKELLGAGKNKDFSFFLKLMRTSFWNWIEILKAQWRIARVEAGGKWVWVGRKIGEIFTHTILPIRDFALLWEDFTTFSCLISVGVGEGQEVRRVSEKGSFI